MFANMIFLGHDEKKFEYIYIYVYALDGIFSPGKRLSSIAVWYTDGNIFQEDKN